MPYLLAFNNGDGGGDGEVEGKKYLGRWAGDRVFLVGDYWETGKYANLYKKVSENDLEGYEERVKNLEAEIAGGYPHYIGSNKYTTFIPDNEKRLKTYKRRLEILRKKDSKKLWKNIAKDVKAEFEEQAGKGALDLDGGAKAQMRPDIVLTAGPPKAESTS